MCSLHQPLASPKIPKSALLFISLNIQTCIPQPQRVRALPARTQPKT